MRNLYCKRNEEEKATKDISTYKVLPVSNFNNDVYITTIINIYSSLFWCHLSPLFKQPFTSEINAPQCKHWLFK